MGYDVDFGLLQPTTQLNPNAALQGYETGVGMAQQAGVRSALSNYADDPNAAINQLIKFGAVDQANALQNLRYTTSQRNLIEGVLAKRQAAQSAQPTPESEAPGVGAAPSPAPTPLPLGGEDALSAIGLPTPPGAQSSTMDQLGALPPAAQQHAVATFASMDQMLSQAQQLPQAQRAAFIQQQLPALQARGVNVTPQDVAGADLSDQGITALRSNIATHLAHPALAQAQPGQPATLGATGLTGEDLTDLALVDPTRATALTGIVNATRPHWARGPNGYMIDENSGATRFLADAPAKGAEPVYNASGQPVGWHMMDGSIQSIKEAATAQTEGEEEGKAPYTPITVPTPKGGTRVISAKQFAAATGPTGGNGTFVSQTPADAEFAKGQASGLNETITAQTAAREPALVQQNNAMQIRNYALSHNMNNAGEATLGLNKWLNTVPAPILKSLGINPADPANGANTATIAQKLTNQSVLSGAKSLLPSRYTERELNLIKPIAGGLNTPSEALAYTGAVNAAIAERQIAQADFAASYNGPKNTQAYQQAWANSPAGQRSLFQSPTAWQGVTLGGKPAVTYFQHNGQTYGAFGAGMGKPYFFKAAPQ